MHHRFASLIQQIKDKLSLNWNVSVENTLPEGNQYADYLAKMGVSQEDRLKIIDIAPHGMSNLLLADASGVAFLRM